jgi:hypothetical protein
MNSPSTTYTLLVTIAHDAGAAPSTELLEAMVQRGLEEGVREMAGVDAATVSAIKGDMVATHRMPTSVDSAKRLHASLRA